MKFTTAPLLAATLLFAAPSMLQAEAPLAEEGETDLEIVNGVPVNPELRKLILESENPLSLEQLIELSNKVMKEQQDDINKKKLDDRSWMGQDPLGHLEGEMGDLASDIQQSDTGEKTQAQGKEVVRKMDTLIAMLEEMSQCSCSGSGSGSGSGQSRANGNSPAQDSTLAAGPGGSGELNAAGQGNNRFEDLEPEQREAILRAQEQQQGFPDEYDALLAEYYQRLASEQALETAEPDAPDQPQ